jgi:hypothetical protein
MRVLDHIQLLQNELGPLLNPILRFLLLFRGGRGVIVRLFGTPKRMFKKRLNPSGIWFEMADSFILLSHSPHTVLDFFFCCGFFLTRACIATNLAVKCGSFGTFEGSFC